MTSPKPAEVAVVSLESPIEQQAETTSPLELRDSENPAIQRALRRLRESQEQRAHTAHHTHHTSHSTHSKGGW
jgi:hypothetical protein